MQAKKMKCIPSVIANRPGLFLNHKGLCQVLWWIGD